ncbi:MAG: molybdenum cofactor biosynthesis protein A [Pelotomaculum sp. PtaU1.Bin065]|nr:MAG: molybdenum cofactor biosynthesis protein A [Pelotomaculum sp. PtaU1.Bin065]
MNKNTYECQGIILKPNISIDIPREYIFARVNEISNEMLRGNIRNQLLLINDQEMFEFHGYNEPERKAISFSRTTEVNKNLFNVPTIIVADHQYHVPQEVMNFFIRKIANGANALIISDTDGVLASSMIYSQMVGISGELINKIAEGNEWIDIYANPEAYFQNKKITYEKYSVDASNILPFYRRRAELTKYPITIAIEPTNRCNFSCIMCPFHGERNHMLSSYINTEKQCDINIDDALCMIDEVSSWRDPLVPNQQRLLIPQYRGEPLIYPHLISILKRAKEKNLRISFSTNGFYMDDELAKKLIDLEIDEIYFSIDALSEGIYKIIRPNSDYYRVINNLKNLILKRRKYNKIFPKVALKFVINDLNFSHQKDYVDYWLKWVDAVALSPENYIDVNTCNKQYIKKFMFYTLDSEKRLPCTILLDVLNVCSNGMVVLCYGGEGIQIGNALKDKLSNIWSSNSRKEVIGIHCQDNYKLYSVCSDCESWFAYYHRFGDNEMYHYHETPVMQHYYPTSTIPIDILEKELNDISEE